MEYFLLKWIHVVSSTVLFGTGVGSAFYKLLADRSGNLPNIEQTNKHVVLADWLFTTPAAIVQPASGVLLMHKLGYPLSSSWLAASIVLYIIVLLCWLPVVVLQIRMARQSATALRSHIPLGPEYRRMRSQWFWLGVPAFFAMMAIFYLMVAKPVLWS